MRRLVLAFALACSPVSAQETEEEPPPLSRSIQELLRDLFSEVEPQLRELRDAIDNLNEYEPPEMLPNGDIIIRRKTPLDPEPEPEPEPEEDLPGVEEDESIEL